MRLFTTDLYRNFAIGFAIGAVIVAVGVGSDPLTNAVSQAQAAPIVAPGR